MSGRQGESVQLYSVDVTQKPTSLIIDNGPTAFGTDNGRSAFVAGTALMPHTCRSQYPPGPPPLCGYQRVSEALRGRGWGEMLAAGETGALARGRHLAWLDTFSSHALDF